MAEATWFIRDKGHIRGPFSKDQLIQLFHRSQLTRFHDISQDRANWIKAAAILDSSQESAPPPEDYPYPPLPPNQTQGGPGGPTPWPPNPPFSGSGGYPPVDPNGAPGWQTSMPPTYLVQAILVTLFCCLPMGIVAIIKSSQVSSAFSLGNHTLAQQKSKEASKWVIIAVVSGLAFFMANLTLIILANRGANR